MKLILTIDRSVEQTPENVRPHLVSTEILLDTVSPATFDAAVVRLRRAAQPQGPFRVVEPDSVPSEGAQSAPDEVGGIELESLGDSREKPVYVVWTDELAANPGLNAYGISDHAEFPNATICASAFELAPRTVTVLLSQAKAAGKKFAVIRKLYKVMTKENFQDFLMESASI